MGIKLCVMVELANVYGQLIKVNVAATCIHYYQTLRIFLMISFAQDYQHS